MWCSSCGRVLSGKFVAVVVVMGGLMCPMVQLMRTVDERVHLGRRVSLGYSPRH